MIAEIPSQDEVRPLRDAATACHGAYIERDEHKRPLT